MIQTALGRIGLCADPILTRLEFLADDFPLFSSTVPTVVQIAREIDAYLKNPNFRFQVPYQDVGTAFQRRVWSHLVQLRVGETVTYGQLAKKLGTGARAVGNACRQNPLPLFIPCHRVLAQRGLGGFSGDCEGRKPVIKRWLLRHEAVVGMH